MDEHRYKISQVVFMFRRGRSHLQHQFNELMMPMFYGIRMIRDENFEKGSRLFWVLAAKYVNRGSNSDYV